MLRTMFGSLLGLGFTALAAAGGLWSAALARFLMPNVVTEPVSRFKAGYPGDYPPGHVETRYKDKFGVWVVHDVWRPAANLALRTTCTHLGCITLWQASEGKFKCPCHGSGFTHEGVNFEGPAPRPLERYAIRLADDGQLEIDRSRLFYQELGQWRRPSLFCDDIAKKAEAGRRRGSPRPPAPSPQPSAPPDVLPPTDSQLAALEEHLPPSAADRSAESRGGDAHQRLPPPAPGVHPEARPASAATPGTWA